VTYAGKNNLRVQHLSAFSPKRRITPHFQALILGGYSEPGKGNGFTVDLQDKNSSTCRIQSSTWRHSVATAVSAETTAP